MGRVLIVDDKPGVRALLTQPLVRAGHDVRETASVRDALRVLRSQPCDLVLAGVRARRDQDEGDAWPHLMADGAGPAVIVFTCSGTVADAVHAIKAGARDYLQLPIEPDHLVQVVRSAIEEQPRRPGVPVPRHAAAARSPVQRTIAADAKTQQLFDRVRRVAEVDCTVLITGESGTGKEVVASTIYEQSRRAGHFVAVNCGAIPDTLAESELFGYHKGAFTGATADKPGLIEQADDGVLFLDEIGEMSAHLQVMLLRFLDSAEMRRIGDTTARHVNVRVIAATNRELEREVRVGGFRHDLFYRLSVMSLHVPPLRQRPADVPALAEHFLRRGAARFRKDVRAFSKDALQLLTAYHWPGNVRELQNVVERALVLASGEIITPEHLPTAIVQPRTTRNGAAACHADADEMAAMIERFGGNQTSAASALGVNRTTLWRRLRRSQHAAAATAGSGAAARHTYHPESGFERSQGQS